jgi:hypothetical protein
MDCASRPTRCSHRARFRRNVSERGCCTHGHAWGSGDRRVVRVGGRGNGGESQAAHRFRRREEADNYARSVTLSNRASIPARSWRQSVPGLHSCQSVKAFADRRSKRFDANLWVTRMDLLGGSDDCARGCFAALHQIGHRKGASAHLRSRRTRAEKGVSRSRHDAVVHGSPKDQMDWMALAFPANRHRKRVRLQQMKLRTSLGGCKGEASFQLWDGQLCS